MSLYQTNFTGLDWGIVFVYLISSIGIGLWANRYVGNLSDYLVAGRTLRIRLALATMTGTELGLVTMMYMAELGFGQQYACLYLALLEAGSLLVIGCTGLVVYRLRQSAVLTIPEYYNVRYSRGVRVVGGCVMVISGVLNMGLFLKAGSQFLTAISGLQDALYLKAIMTGLLLLVLFYTVLGGMVSVVITDLIQFLVLGVGILIVTVFVFADVGFDGFAAVVTTHQGYFDPTSAVNPSGRGKSDPIGMLKIVEMAVIIATASMLWPPGASRTLSVKTPETAQRLFLFSTVALLARRAFPIIWGIGAYFFFVTHGPLEDQFLALVENKELNKWSAMPLYLAKIIPTGLLGLITAGMVAAFMSTHDSYLLCWSGVITQDIVAPLFGPLSQRQRIMLTRVSIVVIGAVLLTWGLWYEISSNLWNYMAVTGTVYLAGALPVVVGGLYWKGASSAGAYCALLGGLFGVCAMGPILEPIQARIPEVQGAHITLLTFAISLIGFVAGSLLFPDKPTPAETPQ